MSKARKKNAPMNEQAIKERFKQSHTLKEHGLTTSQIAAILGVAYNTVWTYLRYETLEAFTEGNKRKRVNTGENKAVAVKDESPVEDNVTVNVVGQEQTRATVTKELGELKSELRELNSHVQNLTTALIESTREYRERSSSFRLKR